MGLSRCSSPGNSRLLPRADSKLAHSLPSCLTVTSEQAAENFPLHLEPMIWPGPQQSPTPVAMRA